MQRQELVDFMVTLLYTTAVSVLCEYLMNLSFL